MQTILLAAGTAVGLLIAYIDSRPSWDDTGITAGAMLLASGLMTLLGYRRPWLIALAIGLWTPLYETYLSHKFEFPGALVFPMLVLLIPLIGAYAGRVARLVIQRTFHPA